MHERSQYPWKQNLWFIHEGLRVFPGPICAKIRMGEDTAALVFSPQARQRTTQLPCSSSFKCQLLAWGPPFQPRQHCFHQSSAQNIDKSGGWRKEKNIRFGPPNRQLVSEFLLLQFKLISEMSTTVPGFQWSLERHTERIDFLDVKVRGIKYLAFYNFASWLWYIKGNRYSPPLWYPTLDPFSWEAAPV